MQHLYSAEPAVIEAARPTLNLLAISQIFFAFYYVYSGALQGAGDTSLSVVIFIITILCVRVPLAYLFKEVAGWGVFGVNLATAIDQTLCSILFYIRYKSGRWKRIKLK
jgi:Na+-driven multidrug efflux pump